ncbi:MAG: TonB-dependent receptor [Pseudomonadota bacterium]
MGGINFYDTKTWSLRAGIAGAACAAALLIATPAATAAQAELVNIDIESQPLDDALRAFSDAYDLAVIAPGGLTTGLTAPAVSGALTADQTLRKLLEGTGLEARRSSTGDVILARRIAAVEPPAPAAPRREVDDVVVVTARKREESLQSVPISISVFDDKEIQRSNFVNFEDFSLRSPNVSFQNNGGAARTLFTIRGVGGGNIASGTGTSVGYYIDEIILNPTGGLRQNDLALLDVERIEVLRGPQGTLFGRNTIGGAVNVVTRKPGDEFAGRVTAGAERFGTYNVQGHINVPIADGVYFQGSGLFRDTDGFIENTTDEEALGSGSVGGRAALRLAPVQDLTIDIAYMRNEVRYDALQGVTEADFDAGLLETTLPYVVENSVVSDLYSARIEYRGAQFDVISLTAFNEFEGVETFAANGFLGLQSAFLDSTISQENISQELRIQSNNADAPVQWLLGGNFVTTDDVGGSSLIVGTPDAPGPAAFSSMQSSEARNIAVFANVEIQLTDIFSLTIGGRYSWDDYELTDSNGDFFPGSNEAFTPSFTLQYEPSDALLVYATASRGYRPGGVDTAFIDLDTTDEITSQFDPETAWNYEIGANVTMFDGRLVARTSVFYLDYNDIQEVFFIPPDDINTITANGAAARIYGAEFEVSAQPTDALSFNVNLGLLDSEFTDFADSPQGDLTGNALPFAPTVNVSAVGEYRRPIASQIDGYFRTEYAYRSEQEGRNNNNAIERQPGYGLLNLRAGLAWSDFQLEVYGENVLDERYFTNRRPGPIVTVAPGRPAIWGVRGTVNF